MKRILAILLLLNVVALQTTSPSVAASSTNQEVTKTSLGARSWAAAITPDGASAYLALIDDNQVRKINVSTGVTEATIGLAFSPSNIVMSPDGTNLFVSELGGSTLLKISTATNSAVATIDTTNWTRDENETSSVLSWWLSGDALFTSDGQYLWVAYENLREYCWCSSYFARVRVSDGVADRFVRTGVFANNSMARAAALSRDGQSMYVAGSNRQLQKISLENGSVLWSASLSTHVKHIYELNTGEVLVSSARDGGFSAHRLSRYSADSGTFLSHLIDEGYVNPLIMFVSEDEKVISIVTSSAEMFEGNWRYRNVLRRLYLSNLSSTPGVLISLTDSQDPARGSVVNRKLIFPLTTDFVRVNPSLRNPTLTFNAINSHLIDDAPFAVNASTDSGRAVSVSSSTPNVCTVNGLIVSLEGVGQCTLRAAQTAGEGWAEASLDRSFMVTYDTVTAHLSRSLTAGGPSISEPVLVGSQVFLTAASSNAMSGSITRFEWDLDGDGQFEADGTATSTIATAFTTPGIKRVSVRVTSRGGLTDTKSLDVEVRATPPNGETGFSISAGAAYTNSRSVKLRLVWPAFATEARISNDGGFSFNKTRVVSLSESVEWDLDDSVKGVFTKVVYVRFNGSGIDTTKTYSDDIILDTTAPVLESSSAVSAGEKVDVTVNASDDIAGVDKIEIKNGTTSVTKEYNSKISVNEKEIGLAVSSTSIRKMSASSIQIRVRDRAGNWSGFQTLSLAPKLTMKKSASARSIAVFANIKAPSTSKVALKVVRSSAKFCKVSGARLRGLRAGSCRVTVTVTPKKGRATSKTVTLRVTK